MEKAFENYELWWVTGAQLLYGGETVQIVDGHSKDMVDGLNQSGNIPVKVVYKGTANSSLGCTLSHLLRCGLRDYKLCKSHSSISTLNTTRKFLGKQSIWTS